MDEQTATYCAYHPSVPTLLRCNKCGQYICSKCAMRTPVGYRCRTCIRGQQQVFETAEKRDLVVAPLAVFGASGLIAAALGVVLRFTGLGSFFYIYFILPMVAGVVTNLLHRLAMRLTEKRRSNTLTIMLTIATTLGALPALLMGFIGGGIYIGVLAISMYYALRGLRLN